MKKKFYILILFFIGVFCFSQAPVDITDPFYEDLNLWKTIGLINDSPEVRPLPLQEINRILNIILETGSPNQIRRATEYKNRFFSRIFHFGGTSDFMIGGKKLKKQFSLAPIAELNFQLNKIFTGSGYFNVSLLKEIPKNEPLPAFQFSDKDISNDGVYISKFKVLHRFNSSITIGTPEYYFSAGMARTSFGPFGENNIIIGDQAFHGGRFVFVINKEKFTYNQIFLALSSTDDQGINIAPKKFLSGHSINYRPLPWLSFGFFDLTVYGGRIEPIYFLPLSLFFVGQSIYNFPDNSLLGLTAIIKPIKGMKIAMTLLADDLGFNEIIKFKEAKWRMAGQFGISYTMPQDHWFTLSDINYTMIMPYCYTHYDNFNGNANYQNYTHNGQPLGSNLPPNSDRIILKLKFRPMYGIDINFSNIFIRHANINESIEDLNFLKNYFINNYSTNGSIFNHATIPGNHAFLYSTPFLTQKTIQYINQTVLDFVFHFPILKSGGNMLFKIGYVFEANINQGINNHMYTKVKGAESWSTDILKQKKEEQLKNWRKQAISKDFNHYFTLSVKIMY